METQPAKQDNLHADMLQVPVKKKRFRIQLLRKVFIKTWTTSGPGSSDKR